ncbi:MAG: Hpt domain-containing protein [Butyrivibrio sp.]|nr:Hpt domain-containing protein [Butyrivibrio sp.]
MNADFKSELIAWGVDWDDILGRFMGNEELIAKFMFKFLNDKNMGELTKYLGEGNVTEAFKAVHALKGVTANLGLKSLLTPVCELTEILRAGSMEGYEEQYNIIKPKYDELVAILEKFKDTQE